MASVHASRHSRIGRESCPSRNSRAVHGPGSSIKSQNGATVADPWMWASVEVRARSEQKRGGVTKGGDGGEVGDGAAKNEVRNDEMINRGRRGSSGVEVDDIGADRPAVVQNEAYTRLLLVEALSPGGARVQEEHFAESLNPFDAENVAVSAHEHVRRVGRELPPHLPLPRARAAGDVGHPQVHALHREPLMLGRPVANIPAVDVTVNGGDRRHRFKGVDDRQIANVSRVENVVAPLHLVEKVGMEKAVRVRQNAEGGHDENRF